MVRLLVLILALLQPLAAVAVAQTAPDIPEPGCDGFDGAGLGDVGDVAQTAPDIPEPGSVEAIAAATGDKHFLSPWVSYLPKSTSVPSPLAFLGRIAGAPGEFVDSAKAYTYCRALASASPRVRVFTIGHSEEGRE